MAKRLRCYGKSNGKPIRLNVGGKIFDVSMETINSFQYLQARLGDNFQSSLDEAGHLFVDRCPQLFEVILQSVRSLTRPRQRYILERKRDLLAECEFGSVRKNPRGIPKITIPELRFDLNAASRMNLFAPLGAPKANMYDSDKLVRLLNIQGFMALVIGFRNPSAATLQASYSGPKIAPLQRQKLHFAWSSSTRSRSNLRQ